MILRDILTNEFTMKNQVDNQDYMLDQAVTISQVFNQTRYRQWNRLATKFRKQVYSQVRDQIRSQVFNQVRNQVYTQVCYPILNQLREDTDKDMK